MRLGHMKSPSLQSQPVTCYLRDLNPGSASRLHQPKLPHLGEERVLASARICLQASLVIHSQYLCLVTYVSWQDLWICWLHRAGQHGTDQAPSPPLAAKNPNINCPF